jgi:hypothetical protein
MTKFPFYIACLFFSLSSFAQNEDISSGALFDGEPNLAVDPANPQHMVIAWMGYPPLSLLSIKTKVTFNAGRTWSSAVAIPHQSPTWHSADPSLVFDHSGNIIICYIDYRQSPDSGAVFVVKSTDGGLTWGAASKVIDGYADGSKKPIDRPWLTISRASTSDTMYVTTKPAPWILPPNRPYFTKSVDGGLTWSPWRYIDSTGWLVGNVIPQPMAAPAVDANGQFHCVYASFLLSQSIYPRYIIASLKPGTNSFTYNKVYDFTTGSLSVDTDAKLGQHLVSDPINGNHHALFFVKNNYGDLDIFCTETLDNGATWTPPHRVNDDIISNGKMQDLVWSNFDENGNLVAAWRDRRNAPDTGYATSTEIWGAVRWKDSANFSPNFRISDTSINYATVLSLSGNDFMTVCMAQDTLTAVWGDVRTGKLNIWFERTAVKTGSHSGVRNIVNETLPDVDIYPSPAKSNITISGTAIISVAIYDISGKKIMDRNVFADKTVLNISSLPKADYIILINTQFGTVPRRFTKL